MKTLHCNAHRQLFLTNADMPVVSPGGAILKVNACGICGTDVEKWQERPHPENSVLGHELVGTLVSICPTYKGRFQVGDRVVVAHHVPCGQCRYCLNDSESMCEQFKRSNITPGGFSEMVTLTEAHLKKTAFLVPASVPDARAIHVEPMACVLKAIRRGGAYQQGKVLVVGLGYIGLMAAQVYQRRGDTVYSVDTRLERLKTSQSFHLHRTAFLPDQLKEVDFDVVFLTVVNPATVAMATERVRHGGTIVVFADSPHQPSLFDASMLYHREVRVVPSYSPGLQDLKAATRVVFNEDIRLTPLVTHWSALDDAPALFDVVRQRQAIKAVVYPNGIPRREQPIETAEPLPPQADEDLSTQADDSTTEQLANPRFEWPGSTIDALSASLSL